MYKVAKGLGTDYEVIDEDVPSPHGHYTLCTVYAGIPDVDSKDVAEKIARLFNRNTQKERENKVFTFINEVFSEDIQPIADLMVELAYGEPTHWTAGTDEEGVGIITTYKTRDKTAQELARDLDCKRVRVQRLEKVLAEAKEDLEMSLIEAKEDLEKAGG